MIVANFPGFGDFLANTQVFRTLEVVWHHSLQGKLFRNHQEILGKKFMRKLTLEYILIVSMFD